MRTIFNQINKIYLTDDLWIKLNNNPIDTKYVKTTIRHLGVLTDKDTFYALTHLGTNQNMRLTNSEINLRKKLISLEKDFRGEFKSQFISAPGVNFKNYLNYNLIEIYRHRNKDDFEKFDLFYKINEYEINKFINESPSTEGILFIDNGALQIKKIHTFDDLD